MTDPFFTMSFPWPPSLNTYFSVFGGRKILSKKGRAYKRDVAAIIRLKHARHTRPEQGPVEARIELCPPDKRRRDWDNLHKAVFDALQEGGVIEDDSLVKKASVEFRAPQSPGVYRLRLYRMTWDEHSLRWVDKEK